MVLEDLLIETTSTDHFLYYGKFAIVFGHHDLLLDYLDFLWSHMFLEAQTFKTLLCLIKHTHTRTHTYAHTHNTRSGMLHFQHKSKTKFFSVYSKLILSPPALCLCAWWQHWLWCGLFDLLAFPDSVLLLFIYGCGLSSFFQI